jgi:hypothetical protein
MEMQYNFILLLRALIPASKFLVLIYLLTHGLYNPLPGVDIAANSK